MSSYLLDSTLANNIAKGFDGYEASAGFALIAIFAPLGFLSGYLVTRISFSSLIAAADRRMIDTSVLDKEPIPSADAANPSLEGAAKVVAQQIRTLNVEEALQQEVSLTSLAHAQLGSNDPKKALTTLEAALNKSPFDPKLQQMRGIALRLIDRKEEAIQAFQNARALITPSTDQKLTESIYNSLAFSLLYLPPPQGYIECIHICNEFLKEDPSGAGGAMWVNLACAQGQAAKHAQEQKEDDNFNDAKSSALAAIRKALSINTKWLPRLSALYKPGPQQKADGDDDLSVFQEYPEFEKLFGISSID